MVGAPQTAGAALPALLHGRSCLIPNHITSRPISPAHVPDSSFWARVNPVYHPEYFGSPPNRVCFVRFNACDLNSRTYLGFDGRRHSCRRHDRRTGAQLREIVARQWRSNCTVGKLLSIRRAGFFAAGNKSPHYPIQSPEGRNWKVAPHVSRTHKSRH